MMRFWGSMLLAGMCVIFGCAGVGERLEMEKADISLAELIEKMKHASDPRGLCREASSYVLRQSMVGDGGDGESSVEIKFQKQPYYSKTTVFSKGKPVSVILFNGKDAWTIDPASGNSRELTGTHLNMIRSLGKIGNPSYSYTDIFPEVELWQTVHDSREYYLLKCISENPDISPMLIYVDKNNYLTRMISFSIMRDGEKVVDYSSNIDKYGLFDNVMMAETTTVISNGSRFLYQVMEFKLNVKFPQGEFDLPIPWYNRGVMEEIEKSKRK